MHSEAGGSGNTVGNKQSERTRIRQELASKIGILCLSLLMSLMVRLKPLRVKSLVKISRRNKTNFQSDAVKRQKKTVRTQDIPPSVKTSEIF